MGEPGSGSPTGLGGGRAEVPKIRARRLSGSTTTCSHFSSTYNRLSDESCDCSSISQNPSQNAKHHEDLHAALYKLRAEKEAWLKEKEMLLQKLARLNVTSQF